MKTIIPQRLRPNDLIGVVSPASTLTNEKKEHYFKGLDYLRGCGYRILEGQNVLNKHGYLAGTDSERIDDLNAMFKNSAVKAIFCSRGGYGTPRLLDKIDLQALKKNPKIILGYSDITSLQLAIFAKTGMVTYSGPMVAIEMGKGISPFTEKALWHMLTEAKLHSLPATSAHQFPHIFHNGVAEGYLLGGCLPLVVSLIGTPYLPDMTKAILVLEDIGEDVYRLDRYFSQLRNSGILHQINGLVLGQFINCPAEKNTVKNSLSLVDVINEFTYDLDIPIIGNFPYGHSDNKYTLPIGIKVKLDTYHSSLFLMEPGVQNAA